MMNGRFWLGVALLVLVVGGIVTVTVVRGQGSGGDVPDGVSETFDVEQTDLDVRVQATGNVRPVRQSNLQFGTSSTVVEVFVEEGDRVAAGDVLAMLDPSDLDVMLRAADVVVRQRQVNLEDLEAPARPEEIEVARARADVAQADTYVAYDAAPSEEDLEIAELEIELADNRRWQAELDRDLRLQINPEFRSSDQADAETEARQLENRIDQQEFDIDVQQTELQRARQENGDLSTLGAAREALVNAQITIDDLSSPADIRELTLAAIDLETAALNLETVREQADDVLIVAPFDGVITELNLTVGELPPTNQPAVVLSDTSTYIVELLIDETDVAGVMVDQFATIDLDALPDADVTGAVRFVDVLPDPAEAVPNYRTEITLNDTDAPIRSNMSVTATIATTLLEDVIAVPDRFINETGAQPTVLIIDDAGQLQTVPVTLGQRADGLTQILSGVRAGDRLARVENRAP